MLCLDRRSTVEAHAGDAGDREVDDQDVARFVAGVVARGACDGADRAIGKGLGVEARGGLGVLVVPDADGVFGDHGTTPDREMGMQLEPSRDGAGFRVQAAKLNVRAGVTR